MAEVNINFEVHCDRPIWALHSRSLKSADIRYRVYINDDLITERTWIWEDQIFLNENIWIYGEQGTDNILRLEPILELPQQAKFTIQNIKIIDYPANIIPIDDLAVTFKI